MHNTNEDLFNDFLQNNCVKTLWKKSAEDSILKLLHIENLASDTSIILCITLNVCVKKKENKQKTPTFIYLFIYLTIWRLILLDLPCQGVQPVTIIVIWNTTSVLWWWSFFFKTMDSDSVPPAHCAVAFDNLKVVVLELWGNVGNNGRTIASFWR